jgi:hypothetical protein
MSLIGICNIDEHETNHPVSLRCVDTLPISPMSGYKTSTLSALDLHIVTS